MATVSAASDAASTAGKGGALLRRSAAGRCRAQGPRIGGGQFKDQDQDLAQPTGPSAPAAVPGSRIRIKKTKTRITGSTLQLLLLRIHLLVLCFDVRLNGIDAPGTALQLLLLRCSLSLPSSPLFLQQSVQWAAQEAAAACSQQARAVAG